MQLNVADDLLSSGPACARNSQYFFDDILSQLSGGLFDQTPVSLRPLQPTGMLPYVQV